MIGYRYYHQNIRPYLYDTEKKKYSLLGFTLFSLVFFGAFAIRPSLVTIFGLWGELEKAREAEAILEQKIKDLSQSQILYQSLGKDLILVEEALPHSAQVPAVLQRLALVGGRFNVSVLNAKFEPIEIGSGGLRFLPFSVTLSGQFKDLKQAITALESGVRQLNIKKVKITQGGKERQNLVVTLDLTAYFSQSQDD